MNGNSFGAKFVALVLAVVSAGLLVAAWSVFGFDDFWRDASLALTVYYFWWRSP